MRSLHKKFGFTITDGYSCGQRKMMFHIVSGCPQTKMKGDLQWLNLTDDVAVVTWLVNAHNKNSVIKSDQDNRMNMHYQCSAVSSL